MAQPPFVERSARLRSGGPAWRHDAGGPRTGACRMAPSAGRWLISKRFSGCFCSKGRRTALLSRRPARPFCATSRPASTGSSRACAGSREDANGALDVSCLGTFAMRRLIPRLHRFQATRPGIEVRLSASDAPIEFSRGAYEVAIRVTDHPVPADAPVVVLFDEHVGPVLAPTIAERLGLRAPPIWLALRSSQSRGRGPGHGPPGRPPPNGKRIRAPAPPMSTSTSCWKRPLPGSALPSRPGRSSWTTSRPAG